MSENSTPDPTMPRVMPPNVEQALRTVLSFRNTPTPIEIYDTIREALEHSQPPSRAQASEG